MIFAIAAILIQPLSFAGTSSPVETIALSQPADPDPYSLADGSLPLSPVRMEMLVQPPEARDLLPEAPSAWMAPSDPPALILLRPSKPMTVSVAELQAEGRRDNRKWLTLGAAAHSAATFDAWTTRHAITTAGAQEQDPLFKPFAGNASLYLAIQAGPALMDYFGKKMMYARHSWLRHMWWVPQSASVFGSLFCGAHNLGVHPAAY
jgi:hypothetical protein